MQLYFVRHGQTDSNAQAANNPSVGNDEPLNSLGTQQAHELAEQLKDIDIDVIISSPYRRAQQTAEIINTYHNLPIELDNAWREIQTDGYIDAHTWSSLFNFGSPPATASKESLTDFFERIYQALDQLIAKHPDKTVVVVSHGGVQHAVYAYANKLPLAGDMRISPMRNCEYRIYEL